MSRNYFASHLSTHIVQDMKMKKTKVRLHPLSKPQACKHKRRLCGMLKYLSAEFNRSSSREAGLGRKIWSPSQTLRLGRSRDRPRSPRQLSLPSAMLEPVKRTQYKICISHNRIHMCLMAEDLQMKILFRHALKSYWSFHFSGRNSSSCFALFRTRLPHAAHRRRLDLPNRSLRHVPGSDSRTRSRCACISRPGPQSLSASHQS